MTRAEEAKATARCPLSDLGSPSILGLRDGSRYKVCGRVMEAGGVRARLLDTAISAFTLLWIDERKGRTKLTAEERKWLKDNVELLDEILETEMDPEIAFRDKAELIREMAEACGVRVEWI